MSHLPASLAPWATELDLFPPDLGRALGTLVSRLSGLLGPLHSKRSDVGGDPDGFDGVTRRGDYERLLTTEWLLAEEIPEEFMRRAAMREHSFLRVARPRPTKGRLCLALFDAGPSQMGSPRLVHLALLVLLGRRASRAGAQFGWAVLQRPADPISAGLDDRGVLRLLDSRTALSVSSDHASAWRRRLGDWDELDECWWVGGRELEGLVPETSRIEVEDELLATGPQRVHVSVMRRGHVSAEAALPIPGSDECARLLRDPLAVAAPPSTPRGNPAPRPVSNLVMAPNGTRVLAIGDDPRTLLSYPIPGSPRAGPGRCKRYHFDHEVLAAGWAHRSLVALIGPPDRPRLQTVRGRRRNRRLRIYTDPSGEFQSRVASGPLLELWFPRRGSVSPAVMLQRGGDLFAFATTMAQGAAREIGSATRLLQTRVLSGLLRSESLIVAVEMTRQNPPGIWLAEADEGIRPKMFLVKEAERVIFGQAPANGHPLFGQIAIQLRGRDWLLRDGEQQQTFRIPEGCEVQGPVVDQERKNAGLLLTEADARRLTLLGRDWERPVAEAGSPILEVLTSASHPLIVYRTSSELVALSARGWRPLVRFSLQRP